MINLKYPVAIFAALIFASCSSESASDKKEEENVKDEIVVEDSFMLPQGYWLGRLRLSEERDLPFNMYVKKDSVFFINDQENIGSIVQKEGDQLVVEMPIFDSEFRFSLNDNSLYGFWHNNAKGEDYKLDFTAETIAEQEKGIRFDMVSDQTSDFSGQWEVTFNPKTEDEYKAIGIFSQVDNEVSGTFLTETGDYRFLQGNSADNQMQLSAFDGAHAFLFEANLNGDSLFGDFLSGSHYQSKWVAVRNEDFELTNPDSLTRMQIGKELSFSFPGIDGSLVEYPSSKYENKVTIIHILGSWCPNCMDETQFLTELHQNYGSEGLEIIGVAFENPESLEDKIKRVQALKSHFGSEYTFCIGGDASKSTATSVIPALSKIISFPTSVFIDKNGVVRRVHTGFYGPGTGAYYMKFVEKTNKLIKEMLSE